MRPYDNNVQNGNFQMTKRQIRMMLRPDSPSSESEKSDSSQEKHMTFIKMELKDNERAFVHSTSSDTDHSRGNPPSFNQNKFNYSQLKKKAVEDQKKILALTEDNMNMKEKNLALIEDNLNVKKKNLALIEDNLNLRKQNLDQREKDLVKTLNLKEKSQDQREVMLNHREKNLEQKETNLVKNQDLKEKNLNRREKKLNQREMNLDQWEKSLAETLDQSIQKPSLRNRNQEEANVLLDFATKHFTISSAEIFMLFLIKMVHLICFVSLYLFFLVVQVLQDEGCSRKPAPVKIHTRKMARSHS